MHEILEPNLILTGLKLGGNSVKGTSERENCVIKRFDELSR